MQRLGKNVGRYLGDTIDIQQVLRDLEIAAKEHGWKSEVFFERQDLKLFGLTRPAVARIEPLNHGRPTTSVSLAPIGGEGWGEGALRAQGENQVCHPTEDCGLKTVDLPPTEDCGQRTVDLSCQAIPTPAPTPPPTNYPFAQ